MKLPGSKLDPHADDLERWFTPADQGGEGLSLKDAQARLRERGIEVSLGRLCKWWQRRSAEISERDFLARIASGAETMRKIEAEFSSNPPAEIEALMRLLRVVVAELTVQGSTDPKKLALIPVLIKPVLDRERQIAHLREIELAESKYRDQVEKARAEMEKLRAPKENLTDADRAAIIAKVDDILGIH